MLVNNADLTGTGHRHQMAFLVSHRLDVVQLDGAGILDLHIVHRGRTTGRTTDMESTHGQLGTGFTD